MITFDINLEERMVFIEEICKHPFSLDVSSREIETKFNDRPVDRRSEITYAAIEFINRLHEFDGFIHVDKSLSCDLAYFSMILSRSLGASSGVDNIANVIWHLVSCNMLLSGAVQVSLSKCDPYGETTTVQNVVEFMDVHAAVIEPRNHMIALEMAHGRR